VYQLAPQLLEFGERQAAMRQASRLFAAVIILAVGIPQTVVASQAQKNETKKAEQKKKPEGASLSGCVDQQEGQFVLVDDHDLKLVTALEAEGFPTEGFAKHVGQKVIVRGTNNPGGTRPAFKVRSIEKVSETCAPQATPEGKK
jgi:hypothetical protein